MGVLWLANTKVGGWKPSFHPPTAARNQLEIRSRSGFTSSLSVLTGTLSSLALGASKGVSTLFFLTTGSVEVELLDQEAEQEVVDHCVDQADDNQQDRALEDATR